MKISGKFLNILCAVFITSFLVGTCPTFAQANKTYLDVKSYKSDIPGSVVEERRLDINNDGENDVLVFRSEGEEFSLDILIRKQGYFHIVSVPEGEEYEIVGSPGEYELRVGHGTFPPYYNPYGSDKYLWYDFYSVIGCSLELHNALHLDFYERQIPRYRERIAELEKEIHSLKNSPVSDEIDHKAYSVFIEIKLKHINRYWDFIHQIEELRKKRKDSVN